MWAKVKYALAAVGAFLALVAVGVGYAARQRARAAAAALTKALVQDAEARGRAETDKARLHVIEGALAKPKAPAPKRTAAEILAEQRRRGQVKE